MTAVIAATGAAWTAWLGYLYGQRRAERIAARDRQRLIWRLNHPHTFHEVTR